MLPLLLGFAWGLLFSVPILAHSARRGVTARSVHLGRRVNRSSNNLPSNNLPGIINKIVHRVIRLVPSSVRRVGSGLATRRHQQRVVRVTEAELPVTIDLLTVAISAGCTPYLAVEAAARWAPPRMAGQLAEVRRACALGWGFGRALNDWAQAVPPVAELVQALLASERTGAPVLDSLTRLAGEQRATARRRSETRARTVPVRLLFPLIFLVLPAFGLLTVVPALLAGFART